MSEFKSSSFRNEDNSGAPDIVGVTSFTSPFYFVPPSGTTAQRPSGDGIAPGMLRFNTDIGRLEVWRGDHWATILGESPNLNGGARMVIGGGNQPTSPTANIDYITMSTLGNSLSFGSLFSGRYAVTACSSSTRAVWGGGWTGAASNILDFVTISSTGNAQDFGDLNPAQYGALCFSNSTRGVWGGAYGPGPNQSTVGPIDYVTIASTGNASDFGEGVLTYVGASCASSTRGIFAGGRLRTTNLPVNTISYITISTTGNVSDFGDLIFTGRYSAGCSNATRGVFIGNFNSPAYVNSIDYITIATTGNAQDFGDMTNFGGTINASASSTRALFAGGGTVLNTIEYITILSTGNSIDFGDLRENRAFGGSASNAHGGL